MCCSGISTWPEFSPFQQSCALPIQFRPGLLHLQGGSNQIHFPLPFQNPFPRLKRNRDRNNMTSKSKDYADQETGWFYQHQNEYSSVLNGNFEDTRLVNLFPINMPSKSTLRTHAQVTHCAFKAQDHTWKQCPVCLFSSQKYPGILLGMDYVLSLTEVLRTELFFKLSGVWNISY